jgi:hypothetical protein
MLGESMRFPATDPGGIFTQGTQGFSRTNPNDPAGVFGRAPAAEEDGGPPDPELDPYTNPFGQEPALPDRPPGVGPGLPGIDEERLSPDIPGEPPSVLSPQPGDVPANVDPGIIMPEDMPNPAIVTPNREASISSMFGISPAAAATYDIAHPPAATSDLANPPEFGAPPGYAPTFDQQAAGMFPGLSAGQTLQGIDPGGLAWTQTVGQPTDPAAQPGGLPAGFVGAGGAPALAGGVPGGTIAATDPGALGTPFSASPAPDATLGMGTTTVMGNVPGNQYVAANAGEFPAGPAEQSPAQRIAAAAGAGMFSAGGQPGWAPSLRDQSVFGGKPFGGDAGVNPSFPDTSAPAAPATRIAGPGGGGQTQPSPGGTIGPSETSALNNAPADGGGIPSDTPTNTSGFSGGGGGAGGASGTLTPQDLISPIRMRPDGTGGPDGNPPAPDGNPPGPPPFTPPIPPFNPSPDGNFEEGMWATPNPAGGLALPTPFTFPGPALPDRAIPLPIGSPLPGTPGVPVPDDGIPAALNNAVDTGP